MKGQMMVDPIQSHRFKGFAGPVGPVAKASAAPDRSNGISPSLPALVTLAQDLAKQGPPVDYARIAQISQAIAQGSFAIDVREIARAMVNSGSTRLTPND